MAKGTWGIKSGTPVLNEKQASSIFGLQGPTKPTDTSLAPNKAVPTKMATTGVVQSSPVAEIQPGQEAALSQVGGEQALIQQGYKRVKDATGNWTWQSPQVKPAPAVFTSKAADTRDNQNMADYTKANADLVAANDSKMLYMGGEKPGTPGNHEGSKGTGFDQVTPGPGPVGQEGSSGQGLTGADLVNQQIQQTSDNLASAEADYRNQINSIRTGTYNLSPVENSQLQAIQDQVSNAMIAQQKANESQLNAAKIMGARSGRSRYSPEIHSGNIGAEISAGIQRISSIQAQGNQALSEARSAMESKDMELLNASMNSYKDSQNARSQAIQQMYENTNSATRLAMDEAKASQDQLKADQDEQKAAMQSSREGAILGLIQQGVTDPASLFNMVNYDDQGNQVGDITFKEVTDTLKAINDAKANPGSYELKGSPSEGLYSIQLDESGQPIDIKELISPPAKKTSGTSSGSGVGGGTTSGTTTGTSTSGLSPRAQAVLDNPGLLTNYTPTEKGKILDELTNAGVSLSNLTLPDVNASQREQLTQFDTVLREADNALDILDQGLDVGPIASPLKALEAKFGSAPVFTKYRSSIDNMSSTLLRARSGGAVTPQEFDRISGFIPNKNDDEATAKSKIARFKEEMGAAQKDYIKRATQTSSEILSSSNPTTSTQDSYSSYRSKVGAGQVLVADSSGVIGIIPESEFDSSKYKKV